jgi:hypothetical protein
MVSHDCSNPFLLDIEALLGGSGKIVAFLLIQYRLFIVCLRNLAKTPATRLPEGSRLP